MQSTGGSAKTPGIFLVLDPATDDGAAVNELHLIENLVNMGAAICLPDFSCITAAAPVVGSIKYR
jgi:hypothetical protein